MSNEYSLGTTPRPDLSNIISWEHHQWEDEANMSGCLVSDPHIYFCLHQGGNRTTKVYGWGGTVTVGNQVIIRVSATEKTMDAACLLLEAAFTEWLNAALNAETFDRSKYTKNQLRATKGVVTKMKKRVGNGVCPCCNRHFSNLENHMKTKHPDYKEE